VEISEPEAAIKEMMLLILNKENKNPQPPTLIQMDNTTAEGAINNKIQSTRTKAMVMRFHWSRDLEQRKQFQIY